jgi:5-oxoprolinase (ATP-hydrolysing)
MSSSTSTHQQFTTMSVASNGDEVMMMMVNTTTTSTIGSTDANQLLGDGKFHFAIDRGGTFTDIYAILPNGKEIVTKLLSEDPTHYHDAPTEGIRRILAEYGNENKDDESEFPHRSASPSTTPSSSQYSRQALVDTSRIGTIRMGTTVATNALLERNGAATAFITTAGFGDILQIGTQARPNIFDLSCAKPSLLYQHVVEIQERVVLKEHTTQEWLHQALRRKQKKKTLVQHIDDDHDLLSFPEFVGTTGEKVYIVTEPDPIQVQTQLEYVKSMGITSLAICLLHAYVYPEHEKIIGSIATAIGGFHQICLSHEVMAMSKLVSRSHTACAAAYLTPIITSYVHSFQQGFDTGIIHNVPVTFMKSDGGLAPVSDFAGHQAILSGPAGGVVGYAKTSYHRLASASTSSLSLSPIIGFDMGGTSTDVSRYDGYWDHVLETVTAGVSIQAPQLDIHTVAAGGGSRLFLKRGMFIVGPESARYCLCKT